MEKKAQIELDNYTLLNRIGQGVSGEVYIIKDIKQM